MTRKHLEHLDGQRLRFRATVERFGMKRNYHGFPEETILLKRIIRVDTGKEVSDHLWFTVRKTIAALDLQPGDTVEFDARVSDYVKGYVNHREYIDERTIDYKLNRPTRFQKVVPAD